MQPRLKTSKKWSPLPDELLKQIRAVFNQGFKEYTQGGKIEAQGRIYPEEILISVGFKPGGGGLRQTNWEISIAYVKNKDNVLKLLHTGVDVIGALFEQSFTAEDDHDFPRLWDEVDFDGRKIYVQYSTTNTELEAAADHLLGVKGADGADVAQGAWDEAEEGLDPGAIKASLGIDPDDLGMEEEDESPPMRPAKSKGKSKPTTASKKSTTKH